MVTIDGEPELKNVEGHPGTLHVVNSPFMIVLTGESYYLYAGQGQWYAAAELQGPWQFTQTVPTGVQSLAPVEEEKKAREQAASAMERR